MVKLGHIICRKSIIIITCSAILLLIYFVLRFTCNPNINTVYIFQTSDIHGYLEHGESGKNGGWLRLGYVIDKEMEKVGRNNCLLIDCGDTFQGSIEASSTKGDFSLKFLNHLNYNIFVPGNHDFDYGINCFLNIVSKLNADTLAANLKLLNSKPSKIQSWKLYEVNNVKIAVIGMTSPYIKYWICKGTIDQYLTSSITDTLNTIIPEVIEAKPDVIILALHHGLYNSKRFPGDDRLLRNIIIKFPEIDIVLGGHTHQAYSGEILYGNSLFVQPGAHGNYLTKIKIDINNNENIIPKIESELIPVIPETIINNNTLLSVSDTIKTVTVKTTEVIGVINNIIDSSGTPGKNCRISKLFAEAIFNSTEADAAMCTVLKPEKTLNGRITYSDIFNICPYEDSVMVLTLSYEDLRKISLWKKP